MYYTKICNTAHHATVIDTAQRTTLYTTLYTLFDLTVQYNIQINTAETSKIWLPPKPYSY